MIEFDTEHENDAEGAMLAVHRDGSTFGQLQAAVTVAHTDFFSFTRAPGSCSVKLRSPAGDSDRFGRCGR